MSRISRPFSSSSREFWIEIIRRLSPENIGVRHEFLYTCTCFFPFCSPTMGQGTNMALTKRQKQVLDFIANFIDENGYCPSYEEIARGLDLASLATVHKHISVLESKNYLKRGFNQSRSLELAPKYLQEQRRPKAVVTEIPLLGRIAAGAPLEAVEQREMLHFEDFAGHGDT